MNKRTDTAVIQDIRPLIESGRYPIKRLLGEDLVVEADIFKDGHDVVAAVIRWRAEGEKNWRETAMTPLIDDRWRGVFPLNRVGPHEYTIQAWGDTFSSWREEFAKKYGAGQRALQSEILEGSALVEAAAKRAGKSPDATALREQATALKAADADAASALSKSPDLIALMAAWPDRALSSEVTPPLRVWVDRERAGFASWYEFFPRSAEGKAETGSTFRDCLGRIDDARAMGFDVIYFPPIHPIGESNRKGRNNSVTCEPGDPGVPYAIGNFRQGVNGGGHKDVAPELGTLEDFDWLVDQVHSRGMEIALDFAINCSPDHPYVKNHPEWFFKRPDGSIKYAENPPKKYEDVYPLNFHNPDWKALWDELRDVLLFWCARGVRIFRVDNPHTKPVAFWEWTIAEVQAQYPDTIFLSEAFTRPKMMRALAKAGFTQGYSYFTWRNTKYELTEYFTELTHSDMKDYFRANLFPNTPDILPGFLQNAGRPAFIIRAVLATTLSPVYGIYSGFELCENSPMPGKEEYVDSEKYHFKGRDWNAPGNIKDTITRLNAIRRENRALQGYANLEFLPAENDNILFYAKATASLDNIILVAVTLDPNQPQSTYVTLPIESFGWLGGDSYQVHDLLTDERFVWRGARNYIALHPHNRPAHIFRLRRLSGREAGRDIFR